MGIWIAFGVTAIIVVLAIVMAYKFGVQTGKLRERWKNR